MALPTTYQQFIALSRYSRYDKAFGRRETWEESIDRLMGFWKKRLNIDDDMLTEIGDNIKATNVMPSMRTLMTAGEALERDISAAYNCSYLPIAGSGEEVSLWDSKLSDLGFDEPIKIKVRFPVAFDIAMYSLLVGCGVGFSVERQYVNTLPTVGKALSRSIYKPTKKNFPKVPKSEIATLDKAKNTIQVPDSKYGWASALRVLIVELYNGNFDVQWDLSQIRPAGAPLKTFGGRASGPDPLDAVFSFVKETFKNANGRKLTSIECHDIACKIGESVVVGGVRRCLPGDAPVQTMAGMVPIKDIKVGDTVYCCNTSAKVIDAGFSGAKSTIRINHRYGTLECTPEHRVAYWVSDEIYDFKPASNLKPDDYLVLDLSDQNASGTGHSKVFSIEEGREVETYDIEVEGIHQFTTNGIVVHNSAMISLSNLSDDRMRKAKSGEWWATDPQRALANNSAVYTEKPDAGTFMREWKSLYESKSGERGIFNREAAKKLCEKHGRDSVHEWGTNPCCVSGETLLLTPDGAAPIADLVGREVSIWNGESWAKVEPYEAGHAPLFRVVLEDQYSEKRILDCTGNHRFAIQGTTALVPLSDLGIGTRLRVFDVPGEDKQHQWKITSISKMSFGEPMTYCVTEPETSRATFNGIVTGNSEIILRPNQYCNLTSIMVRPEDTLDTLKKKARYAAILGTWQATLTDFSYLPPEWKRNCDEERLLGVSMTGLMDHPLLNHVNPEAKQWLNEIRDYTWEVNREWAKRLGINPATAHSAVKPEGTVSQLTDTASGLHPRYSDYYIRRVRADKKDPLALVMQQQGFPCEQDVMQPSNLVFSFPIKAPANAVMRDDRTAIEQLEYWLMLQREYCTHKPSVTIYVKEHEWVSVGAWVYEHFDEISGVSFLPHSDHSYQQAPYEEIDQQQYEDLLAKMPESIDLEALAAIETTDMTNGVQELACTGGACELV